MNFKKIALVVAMASSFAAHAIDITQAEFQGAGAVLAAQEAVNADTTAPAGNAAYIVQEGVAEGGNVAYIIQSESESNYAAVLQQGMGALAYVSQSGVSINRAVIVSIDAEGASPRVDGLATDSNVADLAAAEILAATELSTVGNAALISQSGDAESNSAYIFQNGTKNFAAIVQVAGTAANVALISQIGDSNRAYINQSN